MCSQFKTEIQFVSGFLTGAERVFAIFICTPERPQPQRGDSKHPSGNIQLRSCSLGPFPSHAEGNWGEFSQLDWADSKDLWSCWTSRWGKVGNKRTCLGLGLGFLLFSYKVMHPHISYLVTWLPCHGENYPVKSIMECFGLGETLKMILFQSFPLWQLVWVCIGWASCVWAAQEDTILTVSTDLELCIHVKLNLSQKNQNQIWFGFINLIFVGWKEEPKSHWGLGAKWSFLFSPCLLPSPSKFYFYKTCRWPHLILCLVSECQHFLETLRLLTSQSSAEHSWAQTEGFHLDSVFWGVEPALPIWVSLRLHFRRVLLLQRAWIYLFCLLLLWLFYTKPRMSEEPTGPVGFHVVLEITH